MSASALGVASREHEPEVHETPRKGSVNIASGKTAAGGRYTVWAQPKPRGAADRLYDTYLKETDQLENDDA